MSDAPNDTQAPAEVWVRGEEMDEDDGVLTFHSVSNFDRYHDAFTVPPDLWARYEAAERAFNVLNDELCHLHYLHATKRRAAREAEQRQKLIAELQQQGFTVQPPVPPAAAGEGAPA